jgi:hypothetical protein
MSLAGNRGVAVGLDVGNAHTAMSFKRIGSGGHSEYAAGQQVAGQQPAGQQPARTDNPSTPRQEQPVSG